MTMLDLLDPIYDPADPSLHPSEVWRDEVADLQAWPILAGGSLLAEEKDAGR